MITLVCTVCTDYGEQDAIKNICRPSKYSRTFRMQLRGTQAITLIIMSYNKICITIIYD